VQGGAASLQVSAESPLADSLNDIAAWQKSKKPLLILPALLNYRSLTGGWLAGILD
jgi:hypothetical protein